MEFNGAQVENQAKIAICSQMILVVLITLKIAKGGF